MYLKSLELQGFKSFADKTKIELGGGIAAIVGPNGSGKSNVVEAIQWVLGEQSAKSLRGHKMQDVIFNGTKKRKPLGVAEISIILDNGDRSLDLDCEEVRVTRRLYRSGEGEYLINGKNVRLKDIHRLFADSGIGNDGYAVIGQGRIAEILDSRPEERRSLIEETAGIVKYRERKKEALRKIDRAEDNLLRLADIMTEIEGRLEPLADDARRAEKYLEFAAEKDKLFIGLLGETGLEAAEKLDKINGDIAYAEAAAEETAAAIMVKDAALAEKKAALAMMDDSFHGEEQRYHALKLEIEKDEGNLKVLDSRIAAFEEREAELEQALTVDRKKEAASKEAADQAQQENEQLLKHLDEMRTALRNLEDRRKSESEDLLKAEGEMEALRNKAFEKTREGGQKRNALITAEQQKETATKRIEAIGEKRIKYDQEEDVLNRRIAEINEHIDGLSDEDNALLAAEQALTAEIQKGKEQAIKEEEALGALKISMNRSEARLKVLEELILKREGFYPGVRAVLEWKNKGGNEGIYGVVAELIRVDKTFTVAIEAVLGSAQQNIVTRTGEDAAAAVAFLKREHRGIATFLPLDLLRIQDRRKLPRDIETHREFKGVAADMVTAPLSVKGAVEYLLGNTLIFDSLDAAVRMSRAHKGQFRFVSVDGDIVNAGGAVSGGSRDKAKNGFLQRKSEIEELQRFLVQSEKDGAEIRRRLDEHGDEKVRNRQRGAEITAKREGLKREIAAFDSEINGIDSRRDLFERERASLSLEEEQLKAEVAVAEEKMKAMKEAIAAANAEEQSLMAEISLRENAFKSAKSQESEGRDEYTDAQVAFAEAKATFENNNVNLNRIKSELAAYTEAVAEREEACRQTRENRDRAKAERETLEVKVMTANRNLADFDTDLQQNRGDRDSLAAVIDGLEVDAKNLGKEETAQKEKIYQLSLRRERLIVEKEQSEEALREEYHMLPAEAIPYIDKERTKKDKKERIKELKHQIDALGTVNVGAIEEYKVVSERFTFLSAQRDDVESAKTALEGIVGEMDGIIVKRFKETFDAVNDSFQATFPAFFRGGYGELQLTAADDLLETGVEIIVQPPGKRLQHLSLLSGGEKSLSGIALLFAVLKVKPSPFYVLDEIDAALDDANVKRFSDYLQEYGKDSQFMVITHRQGSMEAAETMYGVTMAEEGVSKTVSVKLM